MFHVCTLRFSNVFRGYRNGTLVENGLIKNMVSWFKKKTKNFMAPFYGRGSTASRLEPLRGGSLLFTTKFPEISGTYFTDLGRMKGWVDLGATQWFWTWDPWIRNPAPWALGHWFGAMHSTFLAQPCKSSSLELDRCLQTIVIQCKYTCILKLLILLPY